MKRIGRRVLLIGALVVGVGGGAAIITFRRWLEDSQRLQEVSADYLSGRVVVVAGWIMSDTEASQLGDSSGVPIAAPHSNLV